VSGPGAWDDLAATWRGLDAGAGTARQLRARIDRDTRRLRWRRGAEVLVTAVVVGAFLPRVADLPAGERGWWVALVAAHVALVWGFAVWNRRGLWAPLGAATTDYLRLARLRLVRTRRAAGFVAGLIGVEAGLVLGLLALRERPVSGAAVAILAAFVLVAAAAAWYRARLRHDLARLESQWAALETDDPGAVAETAS
jgi:hypothetical protein